MEGTGSTPTQRHQGTPRLRGGGRFQCSVAGSGEVQRWVLPDGSNIAAHRARSRAHRSAPGRRWGRQGAGGALLPL